MNKEALIFPGQGSQRPGMGSELLREDNPDSIRQAAERVYEEGSDTLGYDFIDICNPTSEEDKRLFTTRFAQPALFTTEIAYLRVLELMGRKPEVVAGHSAGEYAALVAAGSLEFGPGIVLINERGKAMEEAGRQNPGQMIVVLGLGLEKVREICEVLGVEVAVINEEKQIVIAGRFADIEAAKDYIKSQGGRGRHLENISIASHCSLMEPAKRQMELLILNAPITNPQIPFIQNVTGNLAGDSLDVKLGLISQLVKPVNWVGTIRRMVEEEDVAGFVEVGPGKVLTGMNVRNAPGAPSVTAESVIFPSSES